MTELLKSVYYKLLMIEGSDPKLVDEIFGDDVKDFTSFNIDSSSSDGSDEDSVESTKYHSKHYRIIENLKESEEDTTKNIINKIDEFFQTSVSDAVVNRSGTENNLFESISTDNTVIADFEGEEGAIPSSNKGDGGYIVEGKRVRRRTVRYSDYEGDSENDESWVPALGRRSGRKRASTKARVPRKRQKSAESVNWEEPSKVICIKVVLIDQHSLLVKDKRLEKVYINTKETLGNLAVKIGEMHNLDQSLYKYIKIFIDGEVQLHTRKIGDPLLELEDGIQIDIKFPTEDRSRSKSPQPIVQRSSYNTENTTTTESVIIID